MRARTLAAAFAVAFSGLAAPAFAHPHIYVDAYIDFVMDGDAVAGLKEEWFMRENYSSRLIAKFDADRDGMFSAPEQAALRRAAFDHLAAYAWFNQIYADGEQFAAKELKDFSASIRDGRILYSFYLPLDLKPGRGFLELMLWDETNYVSFALKGLDDPRSSAAWRWDSTIKVDMAMYSAAQSSGQRKIEVSVYPETAPAPGSPEPALSDLARASPVLAAVDQDREERDVTNDDPFLADQKLFGGFASDNPFISFN